MNEPIKEAIWNQLGGSIDMLENAILKCPDEHWDKEVKFWYSAYHCVFWTDYYLSPDPSKFAPPESYTLSEFDPSGILPDRIYSKEELLLYIKHCREKLYKLMTDLSVDVLGHRFVNEYKNYSMLEMFMYNMRHVQHHAAQLNLLLRQTIHDSPVWVSRAKKHNE